MNLDPTLPAEVAAGLRDREAILAQLDAPTRAALEAEAKDHAELLEGLGHVLFFLNVSGGTPDQLAELINRRYEGTTDNIRRPVDVALAIARGEETAAAKAERELREAEERREFIERARARLDDEIADVPTTH
jgi:hypothetical protein